MAMLRSAGARSLLRSLQHTTARTPPTRLPYRTFALVPATSARTTALRPVTARLGPMRWASGKGGDRKPVDDINQAAETEISKERLHAHPEIVSTTSSSRGVMSEVGVTENKEDDHDMMGGVRGDLVGPHHPHPQANIHVATSLIHASGTGGTRRLTR